jgi:hypothetical protein
MQNEAIKPDQLNRRDFHRLATAAFGGVLAGAIAGCSDRGATGKSTAKSDGGSSSAGTVTAATAVALHACRGLNECKTLGKDHKNACAGQGNCYTVSHDCSEKNDSKYQGGCGATYGFNDCKGKGGCGHFPTEDKVLWKKARGEFEARMTKAGKKVGPAPDAAKSSAS